MASLFSWSLNDYDGQKGVAQFGIPEVTDANFVATATALGTLRAAAAELVLGRQIQAQISIINPLDASDLPSGSDLAQRGNKWRVVYRDTQQWADAPTNTIPNYGYLKVFDIELPTADLSLREANNDVIYTAAGGGVTTEVNDFVTAFNAIVRSPYGGTVAVTTIEAVTRAGG